MNSRQQYLNKTQFEPLVVLRLKVDWTFELLWDPLLAISPNLFFWKQLTVRSLQSKQTERVPWVLRDLRTVENVCIFPFFAKNGGKSLYVFILKKRLQLLWILYCMMAVEPTIYC